MSDLIVPELRDFELCKCANDLYPKVPTYFTYLQFATDTPLIPPAP